MLASKAFSSTFHLGMLVQEEASFSSYILQMETQRRELFAQGHRVKPFQIFVKPNISPIRTKQNCR